MQTISGCILKIIYDALYRGQNTLVGGKKQPLLIVLDEAHAYLKAGEESISSLQLSTAIPFRSITSNKRQAAPPGFFTPCSHC